MRSRGGSPDQGVCAARDVEHTERGDGAQVSHRPDRKIEFARYHQKCLPDGDDADKREGAQQCRDVVLGQQNGIERREDARHDEERDEDA